MTQNDINQLKKELNDIKILKIEEETIEYIPLEQEISKKRKVKNLHCSIMFVDMRNSTKMQDENGNKNMTKIYKMFTRTVSKAVEENQGRIMQIVGDGMLCLFINVDGKNSGQLAIDSVKSINTYIQEAYNPLVTNEEKDWTIKCGMGVCSGNVFITRIGVRGKKKCCQLAFPSSITNYASKYCSNAIAYEVIFDEDTYNQLDKYDKDKGEKMEISPYGKCYSLKDLIWEIKS